MKAVPGIQSQKDVINALTEDISKAFEGLFH
jgi:hypothetical protein